MGCREGTGFPEVMEAWSRRGLQRMGFGGGFVELTRLTRLGHRLDMRGKDEVGVGALDWGLGLASAKERKNRF